MSETTDTTTAAARPIPSLTRKWDSNKYIVTVNGECRIELKLSKSGRTKQTFSPNEVRKLISNLEDAADYCEALLRFAEENNPDTRRKTTKKTKKKNSRS